MEYNDIFEQMIDEENLNSKAQHNKEVKKTIVKDYVKDKYGENHGTQWSKDEENILLKSIEDDKTINQIAIEHKRSNYSIHSKIVQIAKKMREEGKFNSKIYKIIKETKDDFHKKENNKNNLKSDINNNSNENKIMNEITEIKSILNVLIELEIKRNNIKKEDFSKLVENDLKKNKNKNKYFNENISDDFENSNFEWTDKILDKIKKNINDKDKLKDIRKKYNISKKKFKKKLGELI